jgi:hypothetical protein
MATAIPLGMNLFQLGTFFLFDVTTFSVAITKNIAPNTIIASGDLGGKEPRFSNRARFNQMAAVGTG